MCKRCRPISRRPKASKLHDAARGRPVDALLANAGRGLGKAFLSQDFNEVRRVVNSNITGTLALLHRVVPGMQQRQQGRVLITGSIAGFMPGSFQAVYNGTKAFIDSFAAALRNELQGSGVTVTCLLPGATDTKFFARADLLDTKLGQGPKDDARDVATAGFEAMMRGNASVITGTKNKLQVAIAKVTPATALARTHRKMAAPGSAEQRSSSGIGMAAGAIAALAIAGVALNRYVQQQRRAHPLRRLYRYSR
jgi:short-subunit dehydrogenase